MGIRCGIIVARKSNHSTHYETGGIEMGNWWNDDASDLQYSVKVDEQDICAKPILVTPI